MLFWIFHKTPLHHSKEILESRDNMIRCSSPLLQHRGKPRLVPSMTNLSCAIVLLGCILFLLPVCAEAQTTLGEFFDNGDSNSNDGGVNIRWASSGGGWRAMFASIGFANVFQQAGLFSANASKFKAIVSAEHEEI